MMKEAARKKNRQPCCVLMIGCLLVAMAGCARREAPQAGSTPRATAKRPTPDRDIGDSQSAARLGHYEISPASLSQPEVSDGPRNFSEIVPRLPSDHLNLPVGFEISTFAEGGLNQPRWMALAENGDVFVAESEAGRITILRDTDNDGRADQRFAFAKGLARPFGLAFQQGFLYVGTIGAILKFKYRPGQVSAEGEPEKIVELPATAGYREHWTRNVIFSADGKKMYVTVGSSSNVDPESDERRAAILELNPDGSGQRLYATGTRNPVGLAFYPGSKTLWAAVQERDLLGDDLVPDYVTSLKDGGFYGWPYFYIGKHEDLRRTGERPKLKSQVIVPDVLIQAHSAALGLIFYDGKMFPKEYQGDAFVALHGSWNRAKRTGYKIIRIHFQNGKPAGGYEDFITGWMRDPNQPEVWGRPVGLLLLRDGSLLIADDGANEIWRVSYNPER